MTFNNIDSVNLTNIDFKNLSEYTMYYKYDLSENIIYYVYDLSENIMQQTVRCSKHLTLLEWCIQQWSSNSLQAGCCQNSVEYWKMYMSVPWIYIYIYKHVCTITYFYVHITNRYKHHMYRFNIPVQVQTCLYMVQTCLYHFKFCQILPGFGTYLFVHTGMYHFEVSRTAFYRVRYVLARASTYHLVLPNSVRASCTV